MPEEVLPELLEPIRARYSPRAFVDQPVEREKLLACLEAARWAASANNGQPWRFIVTQRGEVGFERLVDCLREGNKRWAPAAPVLILTVAKTVFDDPGKPVRENPHAFYDVGAAVTTLVLQATALGLHAHQMGGFYPERAVEHFSIPEPFQPATVVALGYAGEASSLPDDLREREEKPRSRHALNDIAFREGWGEGF